MKLHFNIFIYTYTYFDLSDVIEKARDGGVGGVGGEFKENIQYST